MRPHGVLEARLKGHLQSYSPRLQIANLLLSHHSLPFSPSHSPFAFWHETICDSLSSSGPSSRAFHLSALRPSHVSPSPNSYEPTSTALLIDPREAHVYLALSSVKAGSHTCAPHLCDDAHCGQEEHANDNFEAVYRGEDVFEGEVASGRLGAGD